MKLFDNKLNTAGSDLKNGPGIGLNIIPINSEKGLGMAKMLHELYLGLERCISIYRLSIDPGKKYQC